MHRTNQYDWLGATHPYTFQFIDLRLPAGFPEHYCKENKHRCFVKQAANRRSIFEVNVSNACMACLIQVATQLSPFYQPAPQHLLFLASWPSPVSTRHELLTKPLKLDTS
jgi:hypothetical protein